MENMKNPIPDRVIFDEECKEYMEGWNANNCGKSIFTNPYGNLAYEGELYRLWKKGFEDNWAAWNSTDGNIPKSFPESVVKNSFTITNS